MNEDRAHALQRLLALLRGRGYEFTAVTPATHARVNARPENALARDERGVFGWSRRFRRDALGPELLDAMAAAGILEAQGEHYRSRLRVATLDGVLYWHSTWPTEAGDAVFFGPDTYRFVGALDAWLADAGAIRRALDIGCGAGPGAIIIARAAPKATVLGVDINDSALALARVNARAAGAQNVSFCRGYLFDAVDGEFDLIVANPPYLADPARRAYRHGGGALGAGLSEAIVSGALERLAPGGSLLLYTGVAMVGGRDPFLAAVRPLLQAHGAQWHYRELDVDVFGEELAENPAYAGAERIAAVWLTARQASQ